jgi:hypothetical protein
MKKSKFTEEQTADALRQVERGSPPSMSAGISASAKQPSHLEEEVCAPRRQRHTFAGGPRAAAIGFTRIWVLLRREG